MKIKILLMAVVLTVLLFSLPALAAITPESCGVVPIQQLTYTTTTQVDKFDTNLGTLQSVTVTAEACGYLSDWLESTDQSDIVFNIIARGQVIPTIPGVTETPLQIGTDAGGINFDAVPDGLPHDRTGTDYTSFDIGTASSPECSVPGVYSIPSSAWSNYEAPGGGKVLIPVRTHSSLLVDGSNNVESGGQTFMGVTVCVVYEYIPNLCISGSKVNDCTGDGLPGWTINLKDASGAIIAHTTTGADGSYKFCQLAPGSYTVCEVMQAGWKNIGDTCTPVTLVDANVEGVDFSNAPPFCISGHKYNNLDNTGLPGWTINLKDASGAIVAHTTTGADGSYKFCGQFPGSYTVCEVMQAGWKSVGDTCKPVTLDCADETDVDFRNEKVVTPGCSNRCPWHPVSELYRASCGVLLEVDATHGILANDPVGSAVINPELITIDPKYGTLTVEMDGSFVYDPAPKIVSGTYVTFTYGANNGNCDSTGQGTAKIQVYCKR